MSETGSTAHHVRILQDEGLQDYQKELKQMEKDNQLRMSSWYVPQDSFTCSLLRG